MTRTPRADGPDISHYQMISGPFDPSWKLGTAKCSEGQASGDAMFSTNAAWASPARWIGGYHWLRSDSPIYMQARNFAARIRRVTGMRELPIGWLLQTDWEVTPNIPLVTSDQVIEFNDRLQQEFGRECVITYSSDWLPDSTLDADSRREFDEWREARPLDPLWFANYNTSEKWYGGWVECEKYEADVWQWTSKYLHRSIWNGVKGFDMNHVFNPVTLDRISGRLAKPPMIELPPIIYPPNTNKETSEMNCYYYVVNDERTSVVAEAVLMGIEDANGNCLEFRWSGDSPKERTALTNHINAGMQRREITWGQVANGALVGRLPVGDRLHSWSGDEFSVRLG